MTYWLSQIFVCISYLFLGLSYFTKKRNLILILSLVAVVANGVSYLLLKAWTGVGVICIALIRNALFLAQSKIKALDKYKIDDWIILIVLLIIYALVGVFTFDTIFSLFTIASSLLYTVSVWQHKASVYKILGVISSFCSLIYFGFIRSLFGLILEGIMFIVACVSVFMYFNEKKRAINKETKPSADVKVEEI